MNRVEIVIFIFITVSLLGWIVYLRIREQRYLKKKTKETVSKRLQEEIQKEKAENVRKKEKFETILKQLGGDQK